MTTGADTWALAPELLLGQLSEPTPNGALTTETFEYSWGDGRTAWWWFSVPENGIYALDSFAMGPESQYTILAVYRDVDGTPEGMEFVGGQNGYSSEVVELVASQRYYLQVDFYDGRPVDYQVRVRRTELVGGFSPGFSHTAVFSTHAWPPQFLASESGNTSWWPVSVQMNQMKETAFELDKARGAQPRSAEFDPRYLNYGSSQYHPWHFAEYGVSMLANSDPFDYYVESLWWISAPVYTATLGDGGNYTPLAGVGFLNGVLDSAYHPREAWPDDVVGVVYQSDALQYGATSQMQVDGEQYVDAIGDASGDTELGNPAFLHPRGFSARLNDPNLPAPMEEISSYSDSTWVANLAGRPSVQVPGALTAQLSEALDVPGYAKILRMSVVADAAITGTKRAEETTGHATWEGDGSYSSYSGLKNITVAHTVSWTSPSYTYLRAVDEQYTLDEESIAGVPLGGRTRFSRG